MEEAENIARNEHGSNKISVISGIYKFSSAENRLLLNLTSVEYIKDQFMNHS